MGEGIGVNRLTTGVVFQNCRVEQEWGVGDKDGALETGKVWVDGE